MWTSIWFFSVAERKAHLCSFSFCFLLDNLEGKCSVRSPKQTWWMICHRIHDTTGSQLNSKKSVKNTFVHSGRWICESWGCRGTAGSVLRERQNPFPLRESLNQYSKPTFEMSWTKSSDELITTVVLISSFLALEIRKSLLRLLLVKTITTTKQTKNQTNHTPAFSQVLLSFWAIILMAACHQIRLCFAFNWCFLSHL